MNQNPGRRTILEFDPGKELQPVTGIAVFPTGLKLTEEESAISAVLDCMDMIKEQNEENNTKSVILRCEE